MKAKRNWTLTVTRPRYKLEELKDTEAHWLEFYDRNFNVCYSCSDCGVSALNDYRGNSVDSRFCPNCGKRMVNSTMEER